VGFVGWLGRCYDSTRDDCTANIEVIVTNRVLLYHGELRSSGLLAGGSGFCVIPHSRMSEQRVKCILGCD
jgi:hypothetical protein